MSLQVPFNKQAAESPSKVARHKRRKPVTRPFTIRFTEEERNYLENKAGQRPLAVYLRSIILEGKTEPRRILRKPKADDARLASLLAQLGQSRLSSNVNQLAKHANMGTLDTSAETEQELKDAAQAIIEMRKALFMALGLKP